MDSEPKTRSNLLSGDTELEGLELTDKLPAVVVTGAIPALALLVTPPISVTDDL